MESVSLVLYSSSLIQNHPKTQKLLSFLPSSIPSHSKSNRLKTIFHNTHLSSKKKPHTPKLRQTHHFLLLRSSSFFEKLSKTHLPLALIHLSHLFLTTLPCFASETEQASGKIDLEAILVAIDDFNNRNPFFVAGCTFIWLVVIPIAEEYFRKYKFISAIDAFRKLRDDPNAQLLDIRDDKSLAYLKSPNLKVLNKVVVHVQYAEEDKEGFVKKVLDYFGDTANSTVVCVLDNFDGHSMEVAELLFKNGFKETYAIRGGVRGNKGWLAIQDTLLPPSLHMYPKKKVKLPKGLGTNGRVVREDGDKNEAAASANDGLGESQTTESKHMRIDSRSSSPYPNPPTSPTPSKPRN